MKDKLKVFLRVIEILAIYFICFFLLDIIFNAHDSEFFRVRILSTFMKIIMIVLVGIFTVIVDKKSLSYLGIKWTRSSKKNFFIGTVVAVIEMLFIIGVGAFTGFLKDTDFNNNTSMVIIASLIFLIHCLFTGIAEELLFRGYVLTNLLDKLSVNKAIIVSAIVFLVPHISKQGDILGYIDIFLAGTVFACMYIKTKSLYMEIGFHFMIDFIQYIIFIDPSAVVLNPYYLLKFNTVSKLNLLGINLGPAIELLFITFELLILIWIVKARKRKQ